MSSKYGSKRGDWCSNPIGGSHRVSSWKYIQEGWDSFYHQISFQVGYGSNVQFWHDWWCGEQPLQHAFSRLFSLAQNKKAVVTDCMGWNVDQIHWDIIFHRALQDWELDLLAEFFTLLYSVQINRDGEDTIGWMPTRVFLSNYSLWRYPFLFLPLEKYLEAQNSYQGCVLCLDSGPWEDSYCRQFT